MNSFEISQVFHLPGHLKHKSNPVNPLLKKNKIKKSSASPIILLDKLQMAKF